MGQPRKSSRRVIATSSSNVTSTSQPLSEQVDSKVDNVTLRQKTSTTKASKRASPKKQTPKSTTDGKVSGNAIASKAKPIYSFFGAVAARQDNEQRPDSSAQESCDLSAEDLELILDTSDEELARTVTLSKGSSTASAVRKRRFQYSQGSTESSRSSVPTAQKFLRTNQSERVPFITVNNADKRPWTEQFAPTTTEELAVHKRKVGDVKKWLESAVASQRHQILVLKGPAGAGKTATIQALAHEANIEILEWKNPSGMELIADSEASASAQFENFIARSGRTNSLTLTTSVPDVYDAAQEGTTAKPIGKQQLILIEEFPSTYTITSPVLQAFRSTLLHYLAVVPVTRDSTIPIILNISETLLSTNTAAADSFTAHRLLGADLLTHPRLAMIEFNPIAPTILVKALDAVIVKEARKSGRRRAPGPQILKHLAEAGDIRSALSLLEFLCLRVGGDELWSSKIGFTKPKKTTPEAPLTDAELAAINTINVRESSLSIFHAVGRVVYNNRIDPLTTTSVVHPPSWMPENFRSKLPEKSPDDLINQVGTDVTTFIAALQENYVPSCFSANSEKTPETLSNCIDDLSDADLLSTDPFSSHSRSAMSTSSDLFRQDEISFQLAVRGLLFHLPSPVHRSSVPQMSKGDAHRMFYPTSLKIWRTVEETQGNLRLLTTQAQKGHLFSGLPTTRTTGHGVEGWHRRDLQTEGQPDEELDRQNVPSIRNATLSKDEMLLERLPFLAQIMGTRKLDHMGSRDLERTSSVTSIRGFVVDDDVEGEEDDDDERGAIENERDSWSTDKADGRNLGSKGSSARNQGKIRSKLETEGGGLLIPVEQSVEKLILEDDDIVD